MPTTNEGKTHEQNEAEQSDLRKTIETYLKLKQEEKAREEKARQLAYAKRLAAQVRESERKVREIFAKQAELYEIDMLSQVAHDDREEFAEQTKWPIEGLDQREDVDSDLVLEKFMGPRK